MTNAREITQKLQQMYDDEFVEHVTKMVESVGPGEVQDQALLESLGLSGLQEISTREVVIDALEKQLMDFEEYLATCQRRAAAYGGTGDPTDELVEGLWDRVASELQQLINRARGRITRL